MFGKKARRIADLEATAQYRLDKIGALKEELDDMHSRANFHRMRANQLAARAASAAGHSERTAADLAAVEERLDRALRAVARLRAELAAQCRVNDNLADRLLGGMDYNDAALERLGLTPKASADGEAKP